IDGEGPSNSSFHSPALHVVERFTLVNADQIDYEATYTDPNVFTRPWTLRRKIWTRAPKDYQLFEYACNEGNVGFDNIKSGLIPKGPAWLMRQPGSSRVPSSSRRWPRWPRAIRDSRPRNRRPPGPHRQ